MPILCIQQGREKKKKYQYGEDGENFTAENTAAREIFSKVINPSIFLFISTMGKC